MPTNKFNFTYLLIYAIISTQLLDFEYIHITTRHQTLVYYNYAILLE